MLQYYYLDGDKKPLGPYKEEEIRTFLASGMLKEDSLGAVAGTDTWQAIGELLAASCGVSREAALIGRCPKCEQEIVSAEAPAHCPHCHREIHPEENSNLWNNFLYCLRHYADFKGRATRSEFWGFYLFMYLFSFALGMLGQLVVGFGMSEELMQQAIIMQDGGVPPTQRMAAMMAYYGNPLMLGVVFVNTLYTLGTLVPLLAVTIRRLHDSNHGAYGVWFSVAAMVQMMIAAVCCILLNGNGFILSLAIFLFSFLEYLVLGLYLFIMLLLPGKRGANKYGPSMLYPHG